MHAYINPTYEKLHASAQTGVHLYQVRAYPLQPDGTPRSVARVCELLDQHIRAVTRIDPDAMILVFYDARPSSNWLEHNPQAALVTAGGEHGPQSYFSTQHLEMVGSVLREATHRMERMPYGSRIIGYHILTCGTPDSVIGGVESNLFQTDRSKLTVGDYHPEAIAAFGQYLRDKYDQSVDALRAAWRHDAVTFDTAEPINELLLRMPEDGGVFRDPTEPGVGTMASDYFRFLSGTMERFMLQLGDVLDSELEGRKILGTYYGYDVEELRGYNIPGGVVQNNNFANRQTYASDTLDYHALVPSYRYRFAGGHFEPQGAIASMRLHGKPYLAELDIRTFSAVVHLHGRQRSVTESAEALKQYTSWLIMEGQAGWFADWSVPGLRGVGFFTDPALRDVIAKSRDIYEQTFDVDRTSKAEIAVAVSGEPWFYHDPYFAPPIYNNLVSRMLHEQLPYIGAPHDIYRLEDIGHDFVQNQYKLYIFVNAFVLDDAAHRAIEALKANRKTLLWFYAPGYVSPENGLDPHGIRDATGMTVGIKDGKEQMEYAVTTGDRHSMTRGIAVDAQVAVAPYGNPRSDQLHPATFGPVFYIDDPDATTLGVYPDGRTALAVKGRSIYCAVPYMNAALLRNIAQTAGVHFYCDIGPVVKAIGPFVMVHKGYNRPTADSELYDRRSPPYLIRPMGQMEPAIRVRLREPSQVTDLFTGDTIATSSMTVRLSSPTCKTWLLRLEE